MITDLVACHGVFAIAFKLILILKLVEWQSDAEPRSHGAGGVRLG